MRILQLCNKPPKPEIDGGCIAMSKISQGLIDAGHELKILTASTHKHPFNPAKIDHSFLETTKIESVFLDTRINVIDAFSALVTADSYNISRFFSPDFDKRIREILSENHFDVVHLESLFMTPYIPTIRQSCPAKIVLRSHNLEHILWERLANSAGNRAKRIYLKHLASKLKKYEIKTINEVDGIAAISQEDTDRFREILCEVPLISVPFGIDLSKYEAFKLRTKFESKLFHLGAMNWEPNKEGINWFHQEIWPLVKSKNVSMHLAGREMPKHVYDLSEDNFIVHGEVESAVDFIDDHDIMIVPLLSGAGMRIKIIEGLAMGKAIISTSIGAEGINVTHNDNIIIADSAKEFAQAIKELCANPERVKSIGKKGRQLVFEEYSNSKIVERLTDFYQSI